MIELARFPLGIVKCEERSGSNPKK